MALAGRHEDELGAAQRQRPRDFRHVDFAAHGEPDFAVLGVEHWKLVAGHVLEFPGGAAGIDPWAVRMGPSITRHGAAVRIGHADQIVGSRRFGIDRLDGAEYDVDAVLDRCLGERRRRIESRRHAPRARIGLRKAEEVGTLPGGPFDEAHRVGNVGFILAGRVRNRLNDGDAECHEDSPSKRRKLLDVQREWSAWRLRSSRRWAAGAAS